MSLTIASNIAALRSYTQLGRTTAKLEASFEKLSSGKRINRASDDAAGLSVAASLNSDSRVATIAVRNANDGISTVRIVDGALSEISNTLTRMAELAEQSANGTYSTVQRSALQTEFIALASEIERIAVTTKFNGINLLSGGRAITLQVGFNSYSNSQIQVQAVEGTLQSIRLAIAGSSQLTYSIIDATVANSQLAARTALEAILTAIGDISTNRGSIGAAESRLGTAINVLQTTRENYIAAMSRIEDIDVGQEASELVRLQVLQQAGAAVLAQANLQPQVVLKLLG